MELAPSSAGAQPGTKTWHVIAAYGGRRAGRPEGMYYDKRLTKRSGNSLGGFGDHSRARKIVSLAASKTEDPNTSDWLRTDREGTWEKAAAEYLEKTREKATSLGLAEEQVNDEIASRLAYEALTAQVAHLKKKRSRSGNAAGHLVMAPGVLNEGNTRALRSEKLTAKSRGDFGSAMRSAGYYAKKLGKTMHLYQGNSFMHQVWRVSDKPGEYLNPINNTGRTVISVTPELAVTYHQVR